MKISVQDIVSGKKESDDQGPVYALATWETTLDDDGNGVGAWHVTGPNVNEWYRPKHVKKKCNDVMTQTVYKCINRMLRKMGSELQLAPMKEIRAIERYDRRQYINDILQCRAAWNTNKKNKTKYTYTMFLENVGTEALKEKYIRELKRVDFEVWLRRWRQQERESK